MIAKPTQRLKLEKPCDLELVGTVGRAKSQRLDWACVQYRAVEESRRPWRFRLEHCSTQLKRERAERERERESWSGCCC